jgi:hypothetical protein
MTILNARAEESCRQPSDFNITSLRPDTSHQGGIGDAFDGG